LTITGPASILAHAGRPVARTASPPWRAAPAASSMFFRGNYFEPI
jgi:hypothetical protein